MKIDNRLTSVDGFRALSHIGIVMLHALYFAVGHVPNEGPFWFTLRSQWIFKIVNLGSFSVDLLFLLSGFLLAYNLISNAEKRPPTVFNFVVKRVGRMYPAIIVVGVIFPLLLGDSFNTLTLEQRGKSILVHALLISNYFFRPFHPLALATVWSCCVDIHAGVGMLLLVTLARGKGERNSGGNTIVLAKRMRGIFILAIIVSILIRAYIFDAQKVNDVLAGVFFHIGAHLGPDKFNWHTTHYNRKFIYEMCGKYFFKICSLLFR